MKQTTKRFYGTLACVAVLSGLTGAFAFSLTQKTSLPVFHSTEGENAVAVNESGNIMQLSNISAPASQPVDLTEAAEKACNAVVYIKCVQTSKTQTVEYQDPFADFFGDFFGRGNGGGTQRRQVQTPKRESAGSGVIISADGYIVTNNHVVESADEITITLNDNREFTARVIGLDPDTDLALLKIDATDITPIVIGDSDNLKVGEWVLAVGNPFNLTSTVTAGIVSAKARNLGANKNGIESFIQTDAAINAGNSGGALVNTRGELVGINAMLYSQTGSFTGYGFAIPVSIMKKVVSDLQSFGTVQRAMLGVSGMTLHDYIDSQKSKDEKFDADFGTIDGVYVAEVVKDGAAEDAGLKSGDIIVSVDGKKITKMSELQEATTKYRPGDKATVGYIRDKKEKTATLTFRNAKGNTNVIKTQSVSALGAEFKELTESQKKSLNMTYGVQVSQIKSGYLQEAGVPENFIILKINNQNIKSVKDIENIFKSAQQSDEQTLWIWGKTPAGKAMSFAVQVGE
ncbi:MAG: Do family serine endopeptidase [Prevotellaceae bacterium]|nr:Do family serine endopeptidase [Candidatus Minthosoma caballi]